MRQGIRNDRASICLSVCPTIPPPHSAAASLLLSAPQAGDVNRLLHGVPAACARGSNGAAACSTTDSSKCEQCQLQPPYVEG